MPTITRTREQKIAALSRIHGALQNLWLVVRDVYLHGFTRAAAPQWTARNAERQADESRVRLPLNKMMFGIRRRFGSDVSLATLGRRAWEVTGDKKKARALVKRRLLSKISKAEVERLKRPIFHELAISTKRSEDAVADILGIPHSPSWEKHPDFRKQVSDYTDVEGVFVSEYPELVNQTDVFLNDAVGQYSQTVSNVVVDASNPAKPRTIGEVAKEIKGTVPGMTSRRANMIARTETARTYGATSFEQYKRNGIQRRQTLTAAGSPAAAISPVCDLCADILSDGWVDTEDSFSSTVLGGFKGDFPPYHPNCRCDTVGDVEGWLPPMEEIEPGEFDDLMEGEFDASARLGGGVNRTYHGRMKSGRHVFIKPKTGLLKEQLRQSIPIGAEVERERAAWLVNRRMGLTKGSNFVPMPRAVIRKVPNRGVSMVSEFVEESMTLDNYKPRLGWNNLSKKARSDIAVYDSVIGNYDRHFGNVMINPKTKKWQLIDQGLSFPNGVENPNVYGNFGPNDLKIDLTLEHNKSLTKLLKARPEVTAELTPLIGEDAVEMMFERVTWLLDNGQTFGDRGMIRAVWQ